ncbi:MAG: hypothetical protein R6X02_18975, partial [Enhygromyxa sp.]
MTNEIVVFDVAEIKAIDEDGFRDEVVRGPRTRSSTAAKAVQAVPVDVEQLSDNFLSFVQNVRSMLA